jgi:hypothetical protein
VSHSQSTTPEDISDPCKIWHTSRTQTLQITKQNCRFRLITSQSCLSDCARPTGNYSIRRPKRVCRYSDGRTDNFRIAPQPQPEPGARGASNFLPTEPRDPFRAFTCPHKPYYGKVSLTYPRDLEPGLINSDAGRAAASHVVTMTPVHGLLLAR